jgi:transcriptional regulator with XRE-family HTH domain
MVVSCGHVAATVVRMDSTKSAVNAALGAEIRATRSRKNMTRDTLSEISGITPTQIERIENNKRDMSVTQLFRLSDALGLDPEDIVRRAVDAAGGLDKLTADAEAVSEAAGSNVTPIGVRSKDALTAEDADKASKRAATVDPEMDTDEHFE